MTLVSGCTPVSLSCNNCWALAMEKRFKKGDCSVRAHYDRLPRMIAKKPTAFSIWNDLFHKDVPFQFQKDFMDMAGVNKENIYMVLTKRIETASRFSELYELPSNVWIGTTVEDQARAEERIPELVKIDASVRFISAEPLLSRLDIFKWKNDLDWIILGCESGTKRRKTEMNWITDISLFCQERDIPVFIKQIQDDDGKVKKAPYRDLLMLPGEFDKRFSSIIHGNGAKMKQEALGALLSIA